MTIAYLTLGCAVHASMKYFIFEDYVVPWDWGAGTQEGWCLECLKKTFMFKSDSTTVDGQQNY